MKRTFCLLLACLLMQAARPQSGEGYNPDNPADPDLYYTLTVEAAPRSGGTTSPTTAKLAERATVYCQATPRLGYVFKQWMIGDSVVSTSSSFTFTMPEADVVLTAWFEWNPIYNPDNPGDPAAEGYSHHVRVYASPPAGGSFNSSNFLLTEGETTRIYAYPSEGYRFESWMSNGEVVTTDNPMTIRMGTEDTTFTAAFAYNPENPTNPGANSFNPATGEVVVDDFSPGYLGRAIRNVVGDDNYDKVLSITVVGRMASEDFGFAYRYTNCNTIDLSRTTGYNEVPAWAFEDATALTKLYLPMSVERIGKKAFVGCENLKDIYIYGNTPPALEENALDGLPSNVTIHVPSAAIALYKNAEGWKNLNIVALDQDEKSVTVNLPGAVGEYKNLTLELYNVQSGQNYRYVITDRKTYTFYGLMKNTTYNIYVKNATGDIMGSLENIHLEEENVVVDLPYIKKSLTTTLSVLSPEGEDLTSAVGITWYDEKGTYICQGRSVRELTDGTRVKCQIKLDNEMAQLYKQPSDSIYTITEEGCDDGNVMVNYTLLTIGKSTLKGCVKDFDTATGIYGANVSISQTLNGNITNTFVVTTDANGLFEAEVNQAPTRLAVSAYNYINKSLELEMPQVEQTIDDILIKSMVGVTIHVGFTYTPSVLRGEEAETEEWYSDFRNVSYSIFNETTGKDVTQVSTRFPQLVVLEGVDVGDRLRVTATSLTDDFDNVIVETVVETTKTAYTTFHIVEKGGVTATFDSTPNPSVVAMLYDANGNRIYSYHYDNASVTFEGLKEGRYTIISMAEDDYFNTIFTLSQIAQLRLVENIDYCKNEVNISAGIIESVKNGEIPLLDVKKFDYIGQESYFNTNKTSVVAGNYIAFNCKIDYNGPADADMQLVVDFPESAFFVDNSVKVGSQTYEYTLDGNQITIPLTSGQLARGGKVCFCVIPTKGGDFAPSALLKFTTEGVQHAMMIGTAYYNVEEMSIHVPEVSTKKIVSISGKAFSGSNVEIYDNDVLIGQVTTPASGEWNANCELYEAYNLSSHFIHAKVTVNGVEIMTESKECQYDMNANIVKNVEMTYYNGYLHKNIIVDFDLENSKVTPSSYQYYKGGDISFIINFKENDTTKVSNVNLFVFTDKNKTKRCNTSYDEKGYWIAKEYFDRSSGFPVGVNVDFANKKEKLSDRHHFDNNASEIDNKKNNVLQIRDSVLIINNEITNNELDAIETDTKAKELVEKINNELAKDEIDYNILEGLLASFLSLTGYEYNISDFETDSIEEWNMSVLKKWIADTDELLSHEDSSDVFINEMESILAESKKITSDDSILEDELNLFKEESDSIYFDDDGIAKRYYETEYDNILSLGLSEDNLIRLQMTDSSFVKIYEYNENVYIVDEKGQRAWVIECLNTSSNQKASSKASIDIISNLKKSLTKTQSIINYIAEFANGLGDEIRRDIQYIEEWISLNDKYLELYRVQVRDLNKELIEIEQRLNTINSQFPSTFEEAIYNTEEYYNLHQRIKQLEARRDEILKKIRNVLNDSKQLKKEIGKLKKAKILKLGILANIMDIVQIGQGLWQVIDIITYEIQDMNKWSSFINSISESYNCKDKNESNSLAKKAAKLIENSNDDKNRFGQRYISSCAITFLSTTINGILSFNESVGWIIKMLGSSIFTFINDVAKDIYNNTKAVSEQTYNIRMDEKRNLKCKEDKEKEDEKEPAPPYSTPISDPSGYVYEGVSSNRLEGVTATAYFMGSTEDMYGVIHEEPVVWDASEYDQENPLHTNENGMYQWDVPQGMWQVKFEKEGYETTYSEWLPVPPPQLDVNIAMTQNRQPEVKAAHAYKDGMEVTFDKYMQPALLNSDNIMVSQNGNYVEGTVCLLDEEHAYGDESVTYASKVRFIPTQPFTAGEVTLLVANRVKSYAGLQMQNDFMQPFDIEQELTAIVADSIVNVPYDGTMPVTVAVLPAEASAGKTLAVYSPSNMMLTTDKEEYVLDERGEATVTLRGELPGMASLTYSIEGFDLTATTLVNIDWNATMACAAPVASIASGSTVTPGTAVYLSCSTENATIYYTLDGSCPCDETSRVTYDGTPVIVNSTLTIRAMATAPGHDDSEVVEFTYLVTTSIADNTDDGALRLYPTPMQGVLHVAADGKTINDITLTAIDGSMVMTSTANTHEAIIDTSSLPPGIYVVDVKAENSRYRRKVIKSK